MAGTMIGVKLGLHIISLLLETLGFRLLAFQYLNDGEPDFPLRYMMMSFYSSSWAFLFICIGVCIGFVKRKIISNVALLSECLSAGYKLLSLPQEDQL